MKGDYSRDTFDPAKHFTRVLMQQGRVQLDSDWNEQAAILLHYLQALARDLIGPYGVPWEGQGFMMLAEPDGNDATTLGDLSIGVGHYYVDGILCEMEQPPSFYDQPNYPLDKAKPGDKLPDPPFLVYLDVWERHITAIEDPYIQEIALSGPDTSARSKTVWQVKVKRWADLNLPFEAEKVTCDNEALGQELMSGLLKGQPNPYSWGVRMAARARVPDDTEDACIVSPEARYRGAENQLYRVEIHRGGEVGGANGATFKWSRENGSDTFAIKSISEATITVADLGRDDRFGLEVGDWVEVLDDASVLRGEIWPLLQVTIIEPIELLVTLSGAPPESVGRDQSRHPLLRRWDHQKGDETKGGLQIANDGAALVVQSDTGWLELEDGIQIRFPTSNTDYFPGNYWLIPARTATGNIEWPDDRNGKPEELEPRGIQHHYAPLAIVLPRTAAGAFPVTDLRHFIQPAASCCPDIAVVNPATVKVGESIPFGARVANISAPVATGLTYTWKIVGATVATANGEVISVKTNAPAEVVATLTVEGPGLPLGCKQTAKGICLVIPRNIR